MPFLFTFLIVQKSIPCFPGFEQYLHFFLPAQVIVFLKKDLFLQGKSKKKRMSLSEHPLSIQKSVLFAT